MDKEYIILLTTSFVTTIYLFIRKKLKHIKEFNLKTKYFEVTYKAEECQKGGNNEDKTNNNNWF